MGRQLHLAGGLVAIETLVGDGEICMVGGQREARSCPTHCILVLAGRTWEDAIAESLA